MYIVMVDETAVFLCFVNFTLWCCWVTDCKLWW